MRLVGNSIVLDFYYIDIDVHLNFLLHIRIRNNQIKIHCFLELLIEQNQIFILLPCESTHNRATTPVHLRH